MKEASNTEDNSHTFVSASQSRGFFPNPGFWGLFCLKEQNNSRNDKRLQRNLNR